MTGAEAGVVIVGGSIGGLRTAEGLRRQAYPGPITVLEAGTDTPYDRTTLSKKLLDPAADGDAVVLRRESDLAAAGITLRLGCRAESLDPAERVVRLAGGERLPYATLVLATGSRARTLACAADGDVHYLRTRDDGLRLREAAATARRAVVIGAGFIGSEVAAQLAARGLDVTVVEPTGAPLARVLGGVIGARLADLHTSHGVRLLPGRAVEQVGPARADRTHEVLLDDGTTLEADLVVAGVGATPEIGWLAGSGLPIGDGVVCDGFCRAAPDVYAVGDIARWTSTASGEQMRIEHWTNAVEQAATVAWNITHPGELKAYAPVPYVWSDQYGQRLQILGRPRASDQLFVLRDDPVDRSFVAAFGRDGQLAGAFTLNASADAFALRRAIAARTPLAQILATAGSVDELA